MADLRDAPLHGAPPPYQRGAALSRKPAASPCRSGPAEFSADLFFACRYRYLLPMRLNEISYTDAEPVDGYGPGFFRIGGKVHRGHVITAASGTRLWQGFDDAAPLLALAGQTDVLFIGTGAEIAHLPADLRQQLEAAGMGVESMASPAACRTYNVLLSEGRRVALAALLVAAAE